MDNGLYKERIIYPVLVKPVRRMHKKEDSIYFVDALEIQDKDGNIVFIENRRAMTKLMRYLKPLTNYQTVSELRRLEWNHLSEVLTDAVIKRNKPFVLLLNDDEDVVGVTTERHIQIPWSNVRESVEEALVKSNIGKVPYHDFSENHWAYMIPIENEYVDSYIDVYGGSNIGMGSCAIKISPRTRTKISVGRIQAPCMNWSRFWGMVVRWFGINVNRLNNIVKLVGAENLQGFFLREVHVQGTEIDTNYLAKQFIATQKTLNSIQPVIETSIYSELDRDEAEAILKAYQVSVDIPDYAVQGILNRLDAQKEYTIGVWNLLLFLNRPPTLFQFSKHP